MSRESSILVEGIPTITFVGLIYKGMPKRLYLEWECEIFGTTNYWIPEIIGLCANFSFLPFAKRI